MRTTLLIAALVAAHLVLSLAPPALANVIIQEVYPDPLGSESGGEAVLLFNNGDESVAVGGWTLETPSANPDARLPANASIPAHGLYLIADTGWRTEKDDAAWADSHHEDAITLRNDGGTLRLRNANGSIVDEVDYAKADEGLAQWRSGDVFITTEPLFDEPLETMASVGIDGTSSGTTLLITENGNDVTSVTPSPGRTKYLDLRIESPTRPSVTFDGVNVPIEDAGTDAYVGELAIPFMMVPGAHDVVVDGVRTTLDVLPLVALDTDVSTLNGDATGDADFGSGGPTIRNAGNIAITVSVARTRVMNGNTSASARILVETDGEPLSLTSRSQRIGTLSPGALLPLSISIKADAPGAYTSSLVLFAKKQ